MSVGAVCECRHYLAHHDNDGVCVFVWKGEGCECKFYRDDSGPQGNFQLSTPEVTVKTDAPQDVINGKVATSPRARSRSGAAK